MIQILLGAVIVLGLMASANLLVTFAVIRRIAAVEGANGAPRPGVPLVPDVGREVADFAAALLSGGEISRRELAGRSVIAIFVSPGCSPCRELIALLKSGRGPVDAPLLIFIAGSADDTVVLDTAAELSFSTWIGAADPAGPVTKAFGVLGYPTVLRVDDGVVTAAGTRLDAVENRQTATAAR